jgi:transcription initiation factor TFIIIB Brf1 subunit/transcription initiation factor TFIIB
LKEIVNKFTFSTCNKDPTDIIDLESGQIICSNCGMLILEKIEHNINQEFHAFTLEEADSRVRARSPTSVAIHILNFLSLL